MRSVLLVIGLAAALVAGVTWQLARRLHRDVFQVRERNDPLDLEVVEVTEATILLRPLTAGGAKELRRPGTYGFEFDGGYGHVGPILELPDDPMAPLSRGFTARRGSATNGTRGRMDSFTFEPDPSAVGLQWEPVKITSGAGTYPAWLIAGGPTRWAIFVHGKGARREEALRVLPAVNGDGWTCLVIAYRNDANCGGKGSYRYGVDEWEDLEAAVRFAVERGAREVVLAGYSMGGGISLSFMKRSSFVRVVRGMILDSPMSDLGALLEMRLKERKVPGALTRVATTIAGRQAGFRPRDAEYHAQVIDVPVLLLHGDEDDVIPIGLSDRFAAGRENVRFVKIPGAGHVRGWNVDREAYETAVREFLRGL